MYIDSNDIKAIGSFLKSGFLKGVTTNPTILSTGSGSRFKQLQDLLALEPTELFVQLLGKTSEEMFADYEAIKTFDANHRLSIKIPVTQAGLETIKKVKEDDPERAILGTLIYSADQGILAAAAGCDYLAPYVNRMLNNAIDPFKAIRSMRTFIDARGYKTKIMAASFKNSQQVIDSLESGAHTATIPPDVLNNMMNKDLALQALQVFEADGQALLAAYGE